MIGLMKKDSELCRQICQDTWLFPNLFVYGTSFIGARPGFLLIGEHHEIEKWMEKQDSMSSQCEQNTKPWVSYAMCETSQEKY